MTTRLNNLLRIWCLLSAIRARSRKNVVAIAIVYAVVGISGCASRSPISTPTDTAQPRNNTIQQSDYGRYSQVPVNRPSYYPLQPVSHAYKDYYHPVGEWTGRLILPKRSERQPQEFVWFEIQNAPVSYHDWIGEWVKLQWQDDPEVQAYVESVTADVQFSGDTWESQSLGRVHPTRLHGLENVGPLESLAGARPVDDVVVMLQDPLVQPEMASQPEADDINDKTPTFTLAIAHDPVQITGRSHGLVQILGPVPSESPSSIADTSGLDTSGLDHEQALLALSNGQPGNRLTHVGDRFWVRHFNKDTQQFDGPTEQVHIPQSIPTAKEVYPSTTADIQNSPLNPAGWYIYGDRDATGQFVVQAIEPRHLMQLNPDQVLLSQQEGLDYIQRDNWASVPQQKGTGRTVLISPGSTSDTDAVQNWLQNKQSPNPETDNRSPSTLRDNALQLSERESSIIDSGSASAIVIHTFGGIGGEKAEPQQLWTTTGHFAYGVATVVTDPLTDHPRLWIEYHQIYAHNPNGIVSGIIHWSDYMGNLQRGWLGTRPISDVLIQIDSVTQPYVFDDVVIEPLNEFNRQLSMMAARYRTGNGTGAAIVTPATSCVQDSNQALYATIQSIEHQIRTTPEIQSWLKEYPEHPQTLRFQSLVDLSQTLENQLTPLGLVRPDWQQNTHALAGISEQSGWIANRGVISALKSWRTLLPRRAHDELITRLLTKENPTMVIRTNQIGGNDPTIEPLAPTTLLGF